MRRIKAAAISFAHGHPLNYTKTLACHDDVDFAAVAEVPGETRRTEMAKEFAAEINVPFFDDYREMADAIRPEIVSLCVSPDKNPDVIIEMARRGIHVLSEKPFAADIEKAREAVDEIRKSGVIFSLDIPTACFSRPVEEALQLTAAGSIGESRVAYCHFLQPKGPRYTYTYVNGIKIPAPYGELQNFGYYGFLLLTSLLRQRPLSVMARMDTFFYAHYRNSRQEDLCLATLTFSGGAVAHIVVGRTPTQSLPRTDFRIELIGETGAIMIDDAMGDKIRVWGPYSETADPYERGGLEEPYYSLDVISRYIDDVVSAIINETAPRITVEDAFSATAFIDACYTSAKSSKPVFLQTLESTR